MDIVVLDEAHGKGLTVLWVFPQRRTPHLTLYPKTRRRLNITLPQQTHISRPMPSFRSITCVAILSSIPLAHAAESPRLQEDLLAQARPTIEAANNDWIPAMKRKDAKAIAAFYAPDGVFIGPDGKPVQGREAVAKMYAKSVEADFAFLRGGLVQDGVVLVPGPMIYEWGHADIEMERKGKVTRSGGNYLTVWKRNAEGTWQIARNLAM
jgi:uncharacterized protein (TIGR02246 family)